MNMPHTFEGQLTPPPGRFAICVSRFNSFITEQLFTGAVDVLHRHGVGDGNIDIYRCPGSLELAQVVRRVAQSDKYVGIVALSCVIRGATPHAQYVSAAIHQGIGQIALSANCAITQGILTADTLEQAVDRAGIKAGNKGADAALACIELVNLYVTMETK